MPNPQRQKGDRAERKVVKLLEEAGFGAERVPLSGAVGGSYTGDVKVGVGDKTYTLEVKSRVTGFTQFYNWLGDGTVCDAVVCVQDRKEPFVVVSFDEYLRLLDAKAHRDIDASASYEEPSANLEDYVDFDTVVEDDADSCDDYPPF